MVSFVYPERVEGSNHHPSDREEGWQMPKW